MTVYEFQKFEGKAMPLALRDGDVVRNCTFSGTASTFFAIVADAVTNVRIEDCSFSNVLNAVRVSRGSKGISIARCHVSRYRTYAIALYECEDVTIEDCTCREPWTGNSHRARQALVAYKPSTGLRVRRFTADGMAGQPWPQGTADQIAIQHAEDFLLEDVRSFDAGENGIAICGCRNGVLRRCRAERSDGHGIQIGLAPSSQVPEGLPCEAVYLEACSTKGNALRRDGTKVAAGFYFQHCRDVLAVACVADEQLQAAHIAVCTNVKLSACALRAPTALAGPYQSVNCGLG